MTPWKTITLLVLTVFASAGASAQMVGKLKREKEASDNDVARALGMEMWKYAYTLEPAPYDIDIWLEMWDKGSSSSQRLTHGKSSYEQAVTGGDFIFSRMDQKTTPSNDHRSPWRVGMSRRDNGKNRPEGEMMPG